MSWSETHTHSLAWPTVLEGVEVEQSRSDIRRQIAKKSQLFDEKREEED